MKKEEITKKYWTIPWDLKVFMHDLYSISINPNELLKFAKELIGAEDLTSEEKEEISIAIEMLTKEIGE